MTPAQTSLYWREWGLCKRALLRHGFARDELEAQRHRIHIEATGKDVSSKKLTNAQLDAILSAFRAYSRPDDLMEQLRIIDQPEQRLSAFRDRATKLAAELCDTRGPAAYLESLAQRICGRSWSRLEETEVAKLCGILAAQVKRQKQHA